MDDSCASTLSFDYSGTVFAASVSDDVCADRYVNCQNGGYRNPDDCRSCRCPDGYAGLFCEHMAENVDRNSECRLCSGLLKRRKG